MAYIILALVGIGIAYVVYLRLRQPSRGIRSQGSPSSTLKNTLIHPSSDASDSLPAAIGVAEFVLVEGVDGVQHHGDKVKYVFLPPGRHTIKLRLKYSGNPYGYETSKLSSQSQFFDCEVEPESLYELEFELVTRNGSFSTRDVMEDLESLATGSVASGSKSLKVLNQDVGRVKFSLRSVMELKGSYDLMRCANEVWLNKTARRHVDFFRFGRIVFGDSREDVEALLGAGESHLPGDTVYFDGSLQIAFTDDGRASAFNVRGAALPKLRSLNFKDEYLCLVPSAKFSASQWMEHSFRANEVKSTHSSDSSLDYLLQGDGGRKGGISLYCDANQITELSLRWYY